jgi:hypothetical protein
MAITETLRSTVLEGLTLTQHDGRRWVATYAPLIGIEGRDSSVLQMAVRDLLVKAEEKIAGLRMLDRELHFSEAEKAKLAALIEAFRVLRDLYDKAWDIDAEALNAVDAGYAEYEDVQWFDDVMGLRAADKDETD